MATVDAELREGFKRILEQEMSGLIHSLDQLIEMHDTYGGTTMQKTYLYKARNALRDGKAWFDWERRQPKRAATQTDAGVAKG